MASALLHAIWRRLPVDFRRGLAHGALSLMAPKLSSAQKPPRTAPVIVVGFLSSPSGLGQAARLAMRAFAAQERDVYGIDLSRNFFETSDRVAFSYRDGRSVNGPADVLININAPYMKYVFQLLGAAFLRHKYVTAYWAWELPRAPEAWREGFDRAHRVAAPSTFVAGALRALKPEAEIVVAMHPVALEELPALPARTAPISEAAPFTIAASFNVASGFERKNPIALIKAYRAAANGRRDWRLRMLASGADHYPEGRDALALAAGGDPTIEITFDSFDRSAYWAWLGRPDLFASLHRAEGFGLGLAEAMALGVPVLATNWSGNAEFMTKENSLPVRYQLVPVADPQRKYEQPDERWAEADVAHAAELMTRAFEEPEWLADLAIKGRADALARFSTFPL
ncbi:MAG: glycosyltransferase family 4 protein [Hyphomonadaceae bacterium]